LTCQKPKEVGHAHEPWTHVARSFPNEARCLRLVPALAVATLEEWTDRTRHLGRELL
jgi:hypothetical protein